MWRIKFESQDGSNLECVYLRGPAHPSRTTVFVLSSVWDCNGVRYETR